MTTTLLKELLPDNVIIVDHLRANGHVYDSAIYPATQRGLLRALVYITAEELDMYPSDSISMTLRMIGCSLRVDLEALLTDTSNLTIITEDGSKSIVRIDELERALSILS